MKRQVFTLLLLFDERFRFGFGLQNFIPDSSGRQEEEEEEEVI